MNIDKNDGFYGTYVPKSKGSGSGSGIKGSEFLGSFWEQFEPIWREMFGSVDKDAYASFYGSSDSPRMKKKMEDMLAAFSTMIGPYGQWKTQEDYQKWQEDMVEEARKYAEQHKEDGVGGMPTNFQTGVGGGSWGIMPEAEWPWNTTAIHPNSVYGGLGGGVYKEIKPATEPWWNTDYSSTPNTPVSGNAPPPGGAQPPPPHVNSGTRMHEDINKIGGVNRDIADNGEDKWKKWVYS